MPGPPSYITDERALIARLHRVEGQVQALQRQVRRQAPCTDILIQLSAATRPSTAWPSSSSTTTCDTA